MESKAVREFETRDRRQIRLINKESGSNVTSEQLADIMPLTKKPAKRIANVQPDAKLALIVGSKPLPRGKLAKAIWDYIKKHNLQDPNKRNMVNTDDALKALFGGKKQVSMFELTKLMVPPHRKS